MKTDAVHDTVDSFLHFPFHGFPGIGIKRIKIAPVLKEKDFSALILAVHLVFIGKAFGLAPCDLPLLASGFFISFVLTVFTTSLTE